MQRVRVLLRCLCRFVGGHHLELVEVAVEERRVVMVSRCHRWWCRQLDVDGWFRDRERV